MWLKNLLLIFYISISTALFRTFWSLTNYQISDYANCDDLMYALESYLSSIQLSAIM